MCLIKIGDLTKKIIKKEKKTTRNPENIDNLIDLLFKNTNIGGSFKNHLYENIKLHSKFNKLKIY